MFRKCNWEALLGEVEGANGVKRHRYPGKATYLVCPGLDREAEPTVELRVKVTLPALAIEVFDYSRWEERPRLGIAPRLLIGVDEQTAAGPRGGGTRAMQPARCTSQGRRFGRRPACSAGLSRPGAYFTALK